MITVAKIIDSACATRLHDILFEAFLPFRDIYTPDAFAATVVSADILKNRIDTPGEYTVYGGFADGQLAGTVSTKLTETGDLYFMSMAVSSLYAGRGVGKALLKSIEEEAKSKFCKHILLETYAPLLHAIQLYENFGYECTGNKRDYSGIEVFEMRKRLR